MGILRQREKATRKPAQTETEIPGDRQLGREDGLPAQPSPGLSFQTTEDGAKAWNHVRWVS